MSVLDTLLQTFVAWRSAVDDRAGAEQSANVQALLAFGADAGSAGLVFDADAYAAAQKLPPRSRGAAASLKHYLTIGVDQALEPTPWFSESFYRQTYPDVLLAIDAGHWRCGYQHFLLLGINEFRSPNASFNELVYLGRNPDVLEVVRARHLPNGLFHFLKLGRTEGRLVNPADVAPLLDLPVRRAPPALGASPAFAEAIYRATNVDVADDGRPQPGLRHWVTNGVAEDLRGLRPRIAGWVENVYLRHNSDLAPYIGVGLQPSGYSHFLLYGAAEGRRWAGADWAAAEQTHLSRAMALRTPPGPEDGPQPLISVIVPVYNTDLPALLECLESVCAQTYPNWQLCLSDDASTLPHVQEVLVAAARRDPRIKAVFAAGNGGISATSNTALRETDGEFVALLDHDDILAPDALLHVAAAFRSAADVDVVYTDEGKLTEDGRLTSLTPKPGWSPELLLSTMYIGHLTAYRRSVIDQVGGFRSVFDGTQDYDLALRVSEIARRVVHVPLPLYLWRMSPASTAGSIGAKPGVLGLQRRAIESALVRRGQPGSVRPGHGAGHWTVVLDPPPGEPLVSIVIPTAGRTGVIGGTEIDLVVNCIQSLHRSESYSNYEIVVVHNGDLTPSTLLHLGNYPHVRFVHYTGTPFNLSDKINLGVREAAGDHVLLLNDDMQAESPDIIRSMLGRMFAGVGIVGGRLLYANGTLQHAGVVWSAEGPTHAMIGEHRLTAGPAERLRVMHNVLAVSGACMFFRRDVYFRCGGFSPRLAVNYNDVDLCLNVQAQGLRIVFNPDVTLFHFESLSKAGTHFWELQLLALSHPGLRDPFWNPTFSQQSPFFELRDPARPAPPSYRAWLLDRIIRRQAGLTTARTVRFSFIMSVFQNKKDQMRALAETIARQTYDNWEWVIVDDGSTLPETLEWLAEIQTDPRVQFIRLATNQGIMAGYGAAFRAATGDYVVPIDADDFLTLDCLHVLATAIERTSGPDVVYSDEDKGTESGDTHSPFLKPDWDPVLFSNICYVCHVCAVKRSAAAEVGAYTDLAAAWCHDWDTLLRLKRGHARIEHVPEVLYHWRIHQGSTASMATGTKPYTIDSQKHVLQQDLQLTGADAWFEVVQNELFPHNGIWRLKPLPETVPRSMLLVMASDLPGRTMRLLGDVASVPRPAECVVMVVGGADGNCDLEAMLPEVKRALWADAGVRWCATLAEAAGEAAEQDRIVVVVDAAVERLSRNCLTEGLGMFAIGADVGAVGGQVLLPDGRVAWRGGYAGFGGAAGAPEYGRAQSDSGYHGMGWCQRTCDAVPSVCFFVRPALLQQALEAAPDQASALRHLVGQVAMAAATAGQRVLYTPFVQAWLDRALAVSPILPADAMLDGSRFYPGVFGNTVATAYVPNKPAA